MGERHGIMVGQWQEIGMGQGYKIVMGHGQCRLDNGHMCIRLGWDGTHNTRAMVARASIAQRWLALFGGEIRLGGQTGENFGEQFDALF